MKGARADRRRRGSGLLLVALTVAAAIGTLLPQTAPPGNGVDLGLHLLFYGMLTVVAFRAVGRIWLAAPLVFLYSAVLEALQNLVPGRSGSADDVIANAIGVACGLLVAVLWMRGGRLSPSLPEALPWRPAVPASVAGAECAAHGKPARPETGA